MKTAEVAIEHVIAGLLALSAFVLPFLQGWSLSVHLDTSEVVGVLGGAYLLGILFDRVSDTVLAPYAQWQRLRKAEKILEGSIVCDMSTSADPFPQDLIEARLRTHGRAAVDWLNTLRSRLRVAREISVLGLPAAAGILQYILSFQAPDIGPRLPGTEPAIYAPTFYILAVLLIAMIVTGKHLLKMSRTNEIGNDTKTHMGKNRSLVVMHAFIYGLLLVIAILTMLGLGVRYPDLGSAVIIATILATVITLLGFWAWWRMTKTYLDFICTSASILEKYQQDGSH